MNNTVSVAMTTFNGEKYIIEQLESLRRQTRPIDEVIIADDMSTDSTVSIICSYIDEYKLVNWRVISNSSNVGWVQNFHNVINLASCDVVFFADQDDVWSLEKINEMMNIINSYDNINVLACKTRYINAKGEAINISNDVLPFGIMGSEEMLYKNNVNNKFLYSIMPGCTMCVKKKFIEYIYSLSLPNELPHDALFWKIGMLLDCCYSFNKPLISYRIHNSNASAPVTTTTYTIKNIQKRVDEANIFKKQIESIMIFSKKTNSKYARILDSIHRFCRIRIDFLEKKTFWKIFKYLTYYKNLKMFVGDIFARITNGVKE